MLRIKQEKILIYSYLHHKSRLNLFNCFSGGSDTPNDQLRPEQSGDHMSTLSHSNENRGEVESHEQNSHVGMLLVPVPVSSVHFKTSFADTTRFLIWYNYFLLFPSGAGRAFAFLTVALPARTGCTTVPIARNFWEFIRINCRLLIHFRY